MKIIKILAIFTTVLFLLIAISMAVGYLKPTTAINPLVLCLSLISVNISIVLNKSLKNNLKYTLNTFAILGFIFISMGVFQFVDFKSIWNIFFVFMAIPLLVGLSFNFKAGLKITGIFYVFWLILTGLLIFSCFAISMKLESRLLFQIATIFLLIFTVFTLIGSVVKRKTHG